MEQESYTPPVSSPTDTDGGVSVGGVGGGVAAGATGKIVAALVAVGVLAAIGASGWYFDWFGSRLKPEEVVQNMMVALADSKGAHTTINADATIRSSESPASQKISLVAESATDLLDEKNAKSWSTTELSFAVQGVSVSVDIEARQQDDVLYFKMSGIPYELVGDLGALQEQWIKVDMRKLVDTISIIASLSPMSAGVEIPDYVTLKEKNLVTAKQMNDVLRTSTIFHVTEVLANENLDGIPVYHYRVELDQDGWRAFMKEYIALSLNSWNALSSGFSGADPDALKTQLEEQLASFVVKGSGELWIGRKDFLLYKFSFTPDIDTVTETDGLTTNITMTLSGTAKEYNQPVTIDVPEQSLPFEQLLQGFLQGFLSAGGSEGFGF